ncbi:MAG: UPF0182 family protein [Gemmatimonadetes bacterium]|nr:UPF0182 family protein [Gemmatimonadota bacterium]
MWTRGRKAAVAAAALVLLLLVGGRIAAEFLVDLLWYRSLGYAEVFWIRFNTGLVVRTVAGLVAGAVIFGNLWVVARSLGNLRVRRRFGNIEIAERLPQIYVVGVVLLISLFSAWWLSAGMGDPVMTLAYLRAVPWGVTDPIFGRDLSFYIFEYPFLNRVRTLVGLLGFWTMLLVGISYVATGALRWSEAGFTISRQARRHLGLLAAALLLVLAWGFWLGRYEVLTEGQGIGGALGYTDVHARIPARMIVAGLAVIAAGTVAYGAWLGLLRQPVLGVGLLIVGALVVQGIFPSLVQRFRVEPDEFARERPYIEMNLAFTRMAYGLGDLGRQQLPVRPGRSPDPDQVQRALAGAPLWDTRPLMQAYQALETRRPYFEFASTHFDRYGPPGAAEQVAVSVRELEVARLAETAQTWQNLHLHYVRGEGAVVSPVSQMTAGGEPFYYISEVFPPRLSPDAPPELALTDPGVYFGERTRGYVILTPGAPQEIGDAGAPLPIDAPPPVEAAHPIGVTLDAMWTKLAFAWAFQTKNLLLSPEVTPGSRIVYTRQVQQRVAALAPYLLFPQGARSGVQPVVSDGRILWILDGYTGSAHFPLAPAERFGDRGVRYLRNSVKATVDGLTGEVRMYAVDEQDPVLRTYARIFPGLFRPITEMPPALQRHLRFSAELLALQARVLREYHVEDARTFYSKADVWDIPTETYRDTREVVSPIYAMLPLPGTTDDREFLLQMPFVAAGRQNMTGLLITRNDPPHYGEQILYELPRDELIAGPQQIESMIDQDPAIAEQLSLWKRGGSDVVRGQMTVVAVDSTLLYVEPLFLEAQASAIPQLERVILASGRRVAMRATPETALAALLRDEPRETTTQVARAAGAAPAPVSAPRADPARVDPDLNRARQLVQRAEAQLRAGDWAGFGESWSELREALNGSSSGARRQP